MLDDLTFECYCSEVLLEAVGSFGQEEQGLLLWEYVQRSFFLVRNFIINETKDCQKHLCVIQRILLRANRCSRMLNYAILHNIVPCKVKVAKVLYRIQLQNYLPVANI